MKRRDLLAGAAGLLGVSALTGCAGSAARTASSGPVDGSVSPTSGSPTSEPLVPDSQVPTPPIEPVRHAYGTHPAQFGDLYRPRGHGRPGVVVIIHGGFWLAEYDLSLGVDLAVDLAGRGYTVLNLEYRRVGGGGGWPNTLLDVAAGIDALAGLGVDTSHVAAVGHSAGGQLAAWAAGRSILAARAPGGRPKVAVTAVVSQAGVLDLATAADQNVGGGAVASFLGGTPKKVPDRYAVADPIRHLPLPAPVLCVHSRADVNVPFTQSTAYVQAAKAAGTDAILAEVAGDHFTLINASSQAWQTVVDALPALLAR